MGDAKDYQLALAPTWLLDEHGESWGLVMGLIKDAHAEGAREAVVQRFVRLCAADALRLHGDDREILRAPGETTEQYRARLIDAWHAWTKAGRAEGILSQLVPAGIVNAVLNDHASVDPSIPTTWATWHLVVDPPHPFNDPIIIGPTPVGSGRAVGDGWLVGFGDDAAIAYTRAVIRKWSPAEGICTGVMIADTAGSYYRRLPI